jgi:hypothetical protein
VSYLKKRAGPASKEVSAPGRFPYPRVRSSCTTFKFLRVSALNVLVPQVTSADEAKALLESEKVIIVLAGAETERCNPYRDLLSGFRGGCGGQHSSVTDLIAGV